MKSTPVVDHMKKEMGEDYVMGRKKDAKLTRVCAEFLLKKLKPVLSMLSPDISKHKSEYDQMISGLLCINPVVHAANTFMYDISKYLVDIVSCWISCMKSFGFPDQAITKALLCIKKKLTDFTYNQVIY